MVIHTNIEPIYAKSVSEFNEYVNKYTPLAEDEIILTKANNISQQTLFHLPAAKTFKRANHMEFHYISAEEHIRVIYATHYDEESEVDPKISYKALQYFDGLMDLIPTDDKEEDIELFVCPENKTSRYYNYCNDMYKDLTITDCYSLDRNSSFLASLLTVYPQSKPWVEKYQNDKLRIKAKPKNLRTSDEKDLLKFDKIFIGWFKNPRYNRSHAWKKVVDNSNRVIHDLRTKIEENGNTVLVVNTDAVKFIGNFDYKTSTDMGGFKFEWISTKMYIKSVKSYAYMDNNRWKFKQAGKTKLDLIKKREDWTLEDFKHASTDQILRIKINENYTLEEYYG